MDRPKVSIVVACRNEAKHIRAFVESLLDQHWGGLYWEAIIADGVSTDGTREILDEYCRTHPELLVITNRSQIVSAGLNAAIRFARGEIILRMDAHTIYAPDYCCRCIETLEITGADNVGGPARTRVEGLRARAIAAAYHSRFSTGGARFHDVNYKGWVDTVPYGCWRKETLENLGLFDELLIRNQDDELNLRLVRAGGKIWQDPKIISWYSPRSTVVGVFRQYFQYGFWKVAVIRKHRLPASVRHIVPAAFVFANILLLAIAAVAEGSGGGHWFPLAVASWLALLGAYATVIVAASIITAWRNDWAILPYLPTVFVVYHISYGLGFLAGIRWLISSPSAILRGNTVFTRITR